VILVAVDSSVVVAALLAWHEHHEPAADAVEGAFRERGVVLPVPALVESYAVMTRLPAPHRLSPRDAHDLLKQNFGESAKAAGVTGADAWALLARLAADGVAGGRTYDALILAAAVKARADVLLTLNSSDFEPLARGDIEIRSPLTRR
jgi:predicted nucleic acid-binding protein